jgi:hypothetical protein
MKGKEQLITWKEQPTEEEQHSKPSKKKEKPMAQGRGTGQGHEEGQLTP